MFRNSRDGGGDSRDGGGDSRDGGGDSRDGGGEHTKISTALDSERVRVSFRL